MVTAFFQSVPLRGMLLCVARCLGNHAPAFPDDVLERRHSVRPIPGAGPARSIVYSGFELIRCIGAAMLGLPFAFASRRFVIVP